MDAENSTWSLDEEKSASGEKSKVLSILLARPPLSEDEIKWKKGDNRVSAWCTDVALCICLHVHPVALFQAIAATAHGNMC